MLESVTIGQNVGASAKKQGNPGLKLSDIARLAGVSVTTASYVINGKAEQQRISNATVERVRAVSRPMALPPTLKPPGCAAGIRAPWGLSCRIWKTPVMRAWPSSLNKVPVPAAISY